MYLTFAIFAALCLITVFLESRAFSQLRIKHSSVYDSLDRPIAFFHGISAKPASFFLLFKYLRMEELKEHSALFVCLSCAYLSGYSVFAYMVWEIVTMQVRPH